MGGISKKKSVEPPLVFYPIIIVFVTKLEILFLLGLKESFPLVKKRSAFH